MPDYADSHWLRGHLRGVLDHYYPTCVDETHGGFVAQLDADTGEVYDPDAKHLVAAARFTRNFALASEVLGEVKWREAAERGVEFLHKRFRDAERGGYHWLLDGTTPTDSRRVCYGHAFVVLAYARAADAGVQNAGKYLDQTWDLLDERFFEPEHGLYRSGWDADWREADPYRGQNANMHACEAALVAYEVTGHQRYLDRAATVAKRLCVDLSTGDGRLWEHFETDWTPDFDYNRDDPAHQFRPWGYQPGHHIEWAKLLAVLDRHLDARWPGQRAPELFETALDGWDDDSGGFYYTLDEDGDPVVDDKYSWEVAEGIGAAAALAERTDDDWYREWYDRFWDYALDTVVAPTGGWYERVSPENDPYPTGDDPVVEPGYHPIGACYESLRSLGE
ncbi:AGE family epimerase/isomerase [Halomicroarcula sp. F13]|uniref:AGE family epimerase/isomerase n=1 Tax=Haloarcula rubra TaxID=2487747 RepID=A0AAW4PMS2_9EURY|nr:AGE family epimerase/isomerase [Halomicroarcula rubra]MBX0322451.1 AGE family epimerase/isomerase [Halomicroarcula rubra]